MLIPPIGCNVIVDGQCIVGDGETPLPIDPCCSKAGGVLWNQSSPAICYENINAELEKLCELVSGQTEIIACLEIIKTNPIAAFDGDVTNLGKCSPDGNPLVFNVITDDETGEVTSTTTLVLIDGVLVPYEGTECIDCSKQYNPVDLWIADPESNFCDYRLYECDGDKYIFNPSTCEYEIIPMGIQTTPYQPSGELVCREAQFAAFELVPGATDVAAIVAAVLAANPLDFDVNGTLVPVTADDVNYIKVTPKACGTFDSAGNEIMVDFINVNGSAASNFVDVEDGGVDAATTIEVPATGCALVDVCFKKCWTKQEVAAL